MTRLAAVLLLLALAPAARAATPVIGSGSLNDAPLVGPGEHSDTILPGEQLFYAVRVEEGQRLAVSARTPLTGERLRELVALVRFRAIGPLREPLGFDFEGDLDSSASALRFETPVAEEASSDPYRGPGTWYVGVHAHWGSERAPPRAEIPFTFAIDVTSGPGGTPAAAATPAPTSTPAPPRPSVDDEVDPAALGAVGMSGLLLGLLAGGFFRRR